MAPETPSRRFRLPRYWRIAAVFVAMALLQALAAVVSIQLLSAVRAYVTGESLYSKGQKDAQLHLLNYIETQREDDYRQLLTALAVPEGSRIAREALQQPEPDHARAREGFVAGGNHPDDVARLIRMFLWFQHVPFMSRPIATWTEGDRAIGEMRELAERAHALIRSGQPDPAALDALRRQMPALHERLGRLESAFSAQLGEASRTTQRLLLGLNAGIFLVLTLTGLGFVHRSAQIQTATEAALVERQQSLQRLMDSAVEGVYGVDLEGRCTFINKAALRMLGFASEADLLGRDMHALVHHSYADHRPRPAASSILTLACRDGLASHAADEVFWRVDGTSFPAEYWCHPVVHDGGVQGAVATFFDVTERVELQAALRLGEARLERLIDTVTDGVVTVDAAHRIVLFNGAAEAMFGTKAADALGTPIERFIARAPFGPPDDAAGDEPTQPLELTGLSGALHELVGKRENGSEFPVEASLSRLETDRGLLTTVVLRDVTAMHTAIAERRARQALEAANQAKTEFLSRMSHELRTPLNAVIGFSQLLRMESGEPLSAAQLERVQHIESSGQHLLALVNDVLDLARIEAGAMHVLQDPIPIASVVDEAATMVSPLVTTAGVRIFLPAEAATPFSREPDLFSAPVSPLAEDVWVRADRVRLRQVLVNLLSNAIKYNRPGGTVALRWEAGDEHVLVEVADTGQGIPADRIDSLFEPFNRLGVDSSKVEGTGIGLVLSRQLAEMMGGELTLSSTFGVGTVARLRLALARAPQGRGGGAAARQNPETHRQTLRVIYAEDNEVNAELMRQTVRLRPNVSLQIAVNGQEALEMATLDAPDLMLVDMNLGDMTGLDLARLLRRDRATRGIRLVALSADALPEQVDAAMRSGFEGYMTKPVNLQAVIALFDNWSTAD